MKQVLAVLWIDLCVWTSVSWHNGLLSGNQYIFKMPMVQTVRTVKYHTKQAMAMISENNIISTAHSDGGWLEWMQWLPLSPSFHFLGVSKRNLIAGWMFSTASGFNSALAGVSVVSIIPTYRVPSPSTTSCAIRRRRLLVPSAQALKRRGTFDKASTD